MFQKLRAYFERSSPLTEEEFVFLQTLFLPRILTKGSFLLREGEVARYGAFVASGCLRSYIIDVKGKEHIIQFAPENWWLSDLQSITNETPSIYFMDAVEDSEVLLADKASFTKMLANIPSIASSFQAGIQKHNSAKDRRIVSSLSATAEERYINFLNTYPSIAQRVPQHMLASYLGISPETLSRIRKRISRKK